MNWRIVVLLFALITLSSCGSKKALSAYDKGDYSYAFSQALESYKPSLKADKKDALLRVLEESYARVQKNELSSVRQLEGLNSPQYYKTIYQSYLQLEQRQAQLSSRMPLNYSNGKEAKFTMESYTARINSSRDKFTDQLLMEARNLLKTNDKMNYREAHQQLTYLKSIDPYKKGLDNLLSEAKDRGTTYITASIHNSTQIAIPRDLEAALLDFNAMQLNSQWKQFYTDNGPSDYRMELHFVAIHFSPEKVNTREYERSKEIKTGTRQKEIRGRKQFDENGKPIMEDVFKTVHAEILETVQHKAVTVQAQAFLFAPGQSTPIAKQPIQTEFVFSNCFAKYRGDIEAVDDEAKQCLKNKALPFPSNEQMLFDSGEHIKEQFKSWAKSLRIP